ncbi:NUDIX hydrolase [Kitasatospora sp. NPDC097643]|uniref:NUDIX hydrolase n=1 Tax=Kitasatospora sp. NPDC097643 TaxID=3157230 RepID=UPI0033283A9A
MHRETQHVAKPHNLAVTAVVNGQERVLMRWRHRRATDTWAWELPTGPIQPHETPAEAAVRELLENSGWRVSGLSPLVYAQPADGTTDSEHLVFRAEPVERIGPPVERTEWIPLAELRGMIDRHEIVSSATLVGVLYLLLDEAGR